MKIYNMNNINSHTSQYPLTDTNMYVGMLANQDKLISEDRRWEYNGEKEPEEAELDDDHTNYTNKITENNENYDIKTDNYVNNNITENKNTEVYNNVSENRQTEKQTETRINNTKPVQTNTEQELSPEELMLMKLDMLRKLSELAQAGVKLSQNYNMNSDYKMMKYEYELHRGIRAKQNGINWMSSMSLNLIYGIEMLNDTYNPFDLKLTGWSEQMNADINSYYDVFGELYEKYNQPGKNVAPELKLLFMMSGSAIKFHLQKTLMNKLPSLNTDIDNDPVLAEQLRQKAIAQKLKEQSTINNEKLKNSMNKEHEMATQKAQDLNLIHQRELEYQNLKRDNAQKNAELDDLKGKLLNTNNTSQQQTMKMNPLVQRMMMARQNNTQNNNIQNNNVHSNNVNNNNMYNNQQQDGMQEMNNAQLHAKYIEELEKIRSLREQEEKRLASIRENSKETSSTSDSDSKIKNIGLVDSDEVSRTNISFGKSKTKKDKNASIEKEKPKNIRQKKTNINLESVDKSESDEISFGRRKPRKTKTSE